MIYVIAGSKAQAGWMMHHRGYPKGTWRYVPDGGLYEPLTGVMEPTVVFTGTYQNRRDMAMIEDYKAAGKWNVLYPIDLEHYGVMVD